MKPFYWPFWYIVQNFPNTYFVLDALFCHTYFRFPYLSNNFLDIICFHTHIFRNQLFQALFSDSIIPHTSFSQTLTFFRHQLFVRHPISEKPTFFRHPIFIQSQIRFYLGQFFRHQFFLHIMVSPIICHVEVLISLTLRY